MSKVAQYLNEHLQGEITTSDAVRERFSTDGSILRIVPDLVVHPRSTNDIRKVARFAWQLADKGHKLSLTARGAGSDQTGAAIGSGVIINMLAHMNAIFEIDAKQKLVRLQPGVPFKTLNDFLYLQGLTIPSYPASSGYSTVGGAIANNASGVLSFKYGPIGEWVSQLEVVLSNGDVIQTGRISKRELNKKKGQQDFEGEIYRGIDTLLNDNVELLDTIAAGVPDNAGYNIVDVWRRDGSIDLTPLFVGSQGTLGVISEIIMKAAVVTKDPLIGAVTFASHDALRDGMDQLRELRPTLLELIDGRLFEAATKKGKRYPLYDEARGQGDVAGIVLFEFDDKSGRVKKNAAKKIAKLFEKSDDTVWVIEREGPRADELRALREVTVLSMTEEKGGESAPPLLDGTYIPPERFEDFAKAVTELEKKYHVVMALYGHAGTNVYYCRPVFDLKKAADRQKIFKVLNEWSVVVAAHGGHLIAEAGEGRLKAPFAYKQLDADVVKLIEDIRAIFDPVGILNTGVKQQQDLKQLVSSVRSDYDGGDFSEFAASN